MIKKFQQGGQQQQQLDQIFAMINQQPEEALKQLVQSGAKPEDIAKIVQVGVQQGKINPEVGKAVMQVLQGQVSAARHGMKLQYIKSLKHQCADDEEVYYYKKGGSVGCGCKKKEEGGQVPEAKCGAVAKFKTRKAEPGIKMMQLTEANQQRKKQEAERKKKEAERKRKANTWGATSEIIGRDHPRGNGGPDTTKEQDSAVRDRKDNKENIVKKEKPSKFNYHTLMAFKKGNKVVEKFKSARCGSKMKKK